MDPDADPGLETPTRPDLETPVSTPGVSSGPPPGSVERLELETLERRELASGMDASASDSESTRREALRALAATAKKRGIPLRARDGSETSGVPKSPHARPVAIGSPAQYKAAPSAFNASAAKPRALASLERLRARRARTRSGGEARARTRKAQRQTRRRSRLS